MSASWERADRYVVRDIWVEVTDAGEFVVVELQGVRADGSYWVNGFQRRFTRTEWDSMTEDQIAEILRAEAQKNEDAISKWQSQQEQSSRKTAELKASAKYKNLGNKEVWRRTRQATP